MALNKARIMSTFIILNLMSGTIVIHLQSQKIQIHTQIFLQKFIKRAIQATHVPIHNK